MKLASGRQAFVESMQMMADAYVATKLDSRTEPAKKKKVKKRGASLHPSSEATRVPPAATADKPSLELETTATKAPQTPADALAAHLALLPQVQTTDEEEADFDSASDSDELETGGPHDSPPERQVHTSIPSDESDDAAKQPSTSSSLRRTTSMKPVKHAGALTQSTLIGFGRQEEMSVECGKSVKEGTVERELPGVRRETAAATGKLPSPPVTRSRRAGK